MRSVVEPRRCRPASWVYCVDVGRVQRFPLQVTWMVGPPSPWSSRDQGKAVEQLGHRVTPSAFAVG